MSQSRIKFLDRVATAPISWGICEVPEWGAQLSPDRVLSEMHDLGFTATELGSTGFLPTEPIALQQAVEAHDLRLLGGFVPLVMHQESAASECLRQAEETAALLAGAGAWHFITAAVTTADWAPREPLSDAQWDHLSMMLDEVEVIAAANGLTQVLHPHVGTVVETAADVDQVLQRSAVKWCVDTGHLHIGGVDVLGFVKEHFDRVGLVHLKDVTDALVPQLNSGDYSIMQAVQAGIFPNLGMGDVPIAEIVSTLERQGYRQWYVVEQDAALVGDLPPDGMGPIEDVRRSMEFLRHIELTKNANTVGANSELG